MLPSVLLTAAILLLPALLYAWGRQADAFAVKRVTVAGGHRVSEKQALRALRREFLGDNLFTITTGDVRTALDKYCYLAAVEVDRDFPSDLRVRLVEHKPSMYVLAKGRWFVVADTGHVICEVGEKAGVGVTAGERRRRSSPRRRRRRRTSPQPCRPGARRRLRRSRRGGGGWPAGAPPRRPRRQLPRRRPRPEPRHSPRALRR